MKGADLCHGPFSSSSCRPSWAWRCCTVSPTTAGRGSPPGCTAWVCAACSWFPLCFTSSPGRRATWGEEEWGRQPGGGGHVPGKSVPKHGRGRLVGQNHQDDSGQSSLTGNNMLFNVFVPSTSSQCWTLTSLRRDFYFVMLFFFFIIQLRTFQWDYSKSSFYIV